MADRFRVYKEAITHLKKKRDFLGWKIAMHFRPHLDEIVATLLIILYGKPKFGRLKGLSRKVVWGGKDFRESMLYDMQFRNKVFDAVLQNVEFWKARGKDNQGRKGSDRIAEGTILLGCDPSTPLDEHLLDGETSNGGVCCTTHTADFLEVRKEPSMKGLISHTLQNDTQGSQSNYEIGRLITMRYGELAILSAKKNGTSSLLTDQEQAEVVKLVWSLLMPALVESDQFKPAMGHYQTDKEVVRRPIKFGEKKILIVASENNHSRFVQAAMNGRNGDKAHVVIRRSKESGHVSIMTNRALFSQEPKRLSKVLTQALIDLGDADDVDGSRRQAMIRAAKIVDRQAKSLVDQALRRAIRGLRSWELDNMFEDPESYSQELLEAPGSISEVLEWFYHEELSGIFNGGPTVPGTPPTKMSLQEIVDIVVQAFTG